MQPAAGENLRVHVRTVALTATAVVVLPASQSRGAVGFSTTEGTNTIFLYPYGNLNDVERLAIIRETGMVHVPGDLAAHDWQAATSAGTAYLSIIEWHRY